MTTTLIAPLSQIEPDEQARLQRLDTELAGAAKAYESARTAHAKYCAFLEIKYEMSPTDTLDLQTGVITRG